MKRSPQFDIKAYRFFFEHAGYATPPGHVVCAANLARAEKWAKDHGIQYQWELDSEDLRMFLPDDHKCTRDCEHEVLSVWISTTINKGWYCVGGILDADKNYKRVVEAELALEAMIDLEEEARKLTKELLNGKS